MKIIVTADTHGKTESLKKLISHLDNSFYFVHLGDVVRDFESVRPLLDEKGIKYSNVKGNCDFSGPSFYSRLSIEGKEIGIVHGHQQRVKETLVRLDEYARERDLDAILYGHTHISKIGYGTTGILLMCPGSLGEPKSGKASFGVLEISGGILKPRIVLAEEMDKYFEER